jgi:hypothetical protein
VHEVDAQSRGQDRLAAREGAEISPECCSFGPFPSGKSTKEMRSALTGPLQGPAPAAPDHQTKQADRDREAQATLSSARPRPRL